MKILRIVTIILFILSLLVYGGVSFRYNVLLDRVSPQIRCDSDTLEVSVNASGEELLAGVTASDDRDGDLTDQVMIQGISRLLTADTARITYVVMDNSDNLASCTRTIRYTDYERPRITMTQSPVFPLYTTINDLLGCLQATDIKDGDLSEQVVITSQNLNTGDSGAYNLTLQVTNSLGDSEVIPLTIVIDDQAAENPLVTLKEYITYLSAGSRFDPDSYVRTVNGAAYTGTDSGLVIESNVDTATPGCYQVSYKYNTFTVYQTLVVR